MARVERFLAPGRLVEVVTSAWTGRSGRDYVPFPSGSYNRTTKDFVRKFCGRLSRILL